jgi:hypothetical protein
MRSLRIVGLVVVVAALVLGAAQAGSGLAATSPVVPAGGKVAGKGYAYYLKRLELIAIANNGRLANNGPITSISGLAAQSCPTVTVGGQKVAMLNDGSGTAVASPRRTLTCSEPAGRAIYVYVSSNMCSTLRGFQPTRGKTPSDADLVKCAPLLFPQGPTPSATLDGHPVNLPPLVTATGVFFVPKSMGGPARAAAYGLGVLLRGLSKGTHTIQTNSGPPPRPKVTLKVHVA